MFGNLAALSWCPSHFTTSFQLQLGIMELQSLCNLIHYHAYHVHAAYGHYLSFITAS